MGSSPNKGPLLGSDSIRVPYYTILGTEKGSKNLGELPMLLEGLGFKD